MKKLEEDVNPYLENEIGIEPDLMNRREDRMEKSRPQIDESVGCKKPCRDRWFPWQPIVLGHRLKCQQRQQSP